MFSFLVETVQTHTLVYLPNCCHCLPAHFTHSSSWYALFVQFLSWDHHLLLVFQTALFHASGVFHWNRHYSVPHHQWFLPNGFCSLDSFPFYFLTFIILLFKTYCFLGSFTQGEAEPANSFPPILARYQEIVWLFYLIPASLTFHRLRNLIDDLYHFVLDKNRDRPMPTYSGQSSIFREPFNHELFHHFFFIEGII